MRGITSIPQTNIVEHSVHERRNIPVSVEVVSEATGYDWQKKMSDMQVQVQQERRNPQSFVEVQNTVQTSNGQNLYSFDLSKQMNAS